MKILSASQIKEADQYTIKQEPIPSINLMEMSNKDLGKKIQKATVYLDCWMTAQQIRQAKSRKVIFTGLE